MEPYKDAAKRYRAGEIPGSIRFAMLFAGLRDRFLRRFAPGVLEERDRHIREKAANHVALDMALLQASRDQEAP